MQNFSAEIVSTYIAILLEENFMESDEKMEWTCYQNWEIDLKRIIKVEYFHECVSYENKLFHFTLF